MNALPYATLRPYTYSEWGKVPHVILTSNEDWDPTVLGCGCQAENEQWFDAQSPFIDDLNDKSFDKVRSYQFRINNNQLFFFDTECFKDHYLDDVIQNAISCNNVTTKSNETEYEFLKPWFNWIPLEMTKKTSQLPSQHARTPASSVTKKTYRSPFSALNFKRRSEHVATDTVYCNPLKQTKVPHELSYLWVLKLF